MTLHVDGDIVISLYNGYGDAVLALPALRAIRRLFPASNIHIVCREDQKSTVFSGLDIRFLDARDNGAGTSVAGLESIFPQCIVSWNAYFPCAVDSEISLRFGTVPRWGFCDGSGALMPLGRRFAEAHMRDQYFHVLDLKPEYSLADRQVDISERSETQFEHWQRTCGLDSDRSYALHLDSTEDKMWSAEHWVRLVAHIWSEWGAVPLIVGEDSAHSRLLLERFGFARKIPVQLGVATHFVAVRSSAAFVGIDSVFAHVANSFDKPMMALFGAADPRIWGPVGNRSMTVRCPTGVPLADLEYGEVASAADQVFSNLAARETDRKPQEA
jgi:hypothetical protein